MKLMKLNHSIALLIGDYEHHLDHLAPIASLLNLPLVICEESLFKLCQLFYPEVKAYFIPLIELRENLPSSTQFLITCLPRNMLLALLPGLCIPSIWLPHGNSDKGKNTFFMEALKEEQYALLYGEKIIDFLKEKNAFYNLVEYKLIGNFRYHYYQKHQKPLYTKKLKTILYAPTWQPESQQHLIIEEIMQLKNLTHFQVLIKLHPNTLQLPQIQTFKIHFESFSHLHFIENHPPIYPILLSSDLFLGDVSSVGYDFLTLNRPLVFSYHQEKTEMFPPLDLQQTGRSILLKEIKNLDAFFEEVLTKDSMKYERARKTLYDKTFASLPPRMSFKRWINRQTSNISLHC